MMFVELGRPENKMTLSEAIKAVTKDYNNKTDGWIQSNKQLPDKDGKYIITSTDGKVDVIWYRRYFCPTCGKRFENLRPAHCFNGDCHQAIDWENDNDER